MQPAVDSLPGLFGHLHGHVEPVGLLRRRTRLQCHRDSQHALLQRLLLQSGPSTFVRSHARARAHTHTQINKHKHARGLFRLANVWALCIFMNIMIILVAFTRLQPPEQTRTRTRTAADCGCISGHASLLGLVLLHNAQLQRAAAASASLDVLSGQVSLHRGLHCRTADITRHEDCIAGRSYLVRTQFVSSI